MTVHVIALNIKKNAEEYTFRDCDIYINSANSLFVVPGKVSDHLDNAGTLTDWVYAFNNRVWLQAWAEEAITDGKQ